MEDFREFVSCRLCGADDYEIAYEWPANYYDHSKYETASWDGRKEISLRICKCKKCRLPYTNPSFKEEYLGLVYPDDLIPSHESINTKDDFIGLLNLEKYEDLYSSIKKFISKKDTILDIGTRYGGLPYYLRSLGFSSFGLELNDSAVELAKKNGLDYIHKGTIDDIVNFKEKVFTDSLNCIIMDDVLEHLVDPLNNILEISKFQTKGDVLIMRQMNWNGLGHKFFRKNWYYLQPAAHMSFFSPGTTKNLLEKCGYETIRVIKKNSIVNIFRTIVRLGKKFTLGKNKWKTENNKLMYLQERDKMYDDMFIIIAVK